MGARQPVRGSSLVEVLVALLLLSLGLLAMASLQARTLAFAASSRQASVAAQLATDLAERMRSRGEAVPSQAYETAWRSAGRAECGSACGAGAGSGAERDYRSWLAQAAALLPEPAVRVVRAADDASALDIRIAWRAGKPLSEAGRSADCEPGAGDGVFMCWSLRVAP